MSEGRIGYWPLRADCNDHTPHGRHGKPVAIAFDNGAVFDGVDAALTLPVLAETDGSSPFTLSLEFKVNDNRGFLP